MCLMATVHLMNAQTDEDNNQEDKAVLKIVEQIFLPSIEIGYLFNQAQALEGGILVKTSIEYRTRNVEGLFFRISYDQYSTNFTLNPDKLDLIVNWEAFQVQFLLFFFVVGLVLTIGARIIIYLFRDHLGEFLSTVILDVISELGIAVFGGVLTTYYLEYLHEQPYEQNMKFQNEIKVRLKTNQPEAWLSSPEPSKAKQVPSPCTAYRQAHFPSNKVY